jgi:hypothetical protein
MMKRGWWPLPRSPLHQAAVLFHRQDAGLRGFEEVVRPVVTPRAAELIPSGRWNLLFRRVPSIYLLTRRSCDLLSDRSFSRQRYHPIVSCPREERRVIFSWHLSGSEWEPRHLLSSEGGPRQAGLIRDGSLGSAVGWPSGVWPIEPPTRFAALPLAVFLIPVESRAYFRT